MTWIEEQALRDRLTREALDEARQGLGIDHADVVAWAESLGGPTPLPAPQPRAVGGRQRRRKVPCVRGRMLTKPDIPAIQLLPGTYRAALWDTLCTNVRRPVPVSSLPDPVGRGSDPLYASKRLNMKLARANSGLEIRRISIGDYEAYGLFEKGTSFHVSTPMLSLRQGPAYDPKTGRTR